MDELAEKYKVENDDLPPFWLNHWETALPRPPQYAHKKIRDLWDSESEGLSNEDYIAEKYRESAQQLGIPVSLTIRRRI